MKRLSLLMIMMVIGAVSLMARPGYSKPVDVKQPDGSFVTLLMHGDEFRHFMTTTDGYTVVKGEDGYYRYADKDSNGQLSASAVAAINPESRDDSQQAYLASRQKMIAPEMTVFQKEMKTCALQLQRDYSSMAVNNGIRKNRAGGIWSVIDYSLFKGLVILVEFSDRKFTTEDPHAFYQRLTSEKNYQDTSHKYYPVDVEGSARDYFYDNSIGIFDPTFDVVGPVQIDMNSTDVGGKNASNQTMATIFKKAIALIDDKVDFSQYDLDSNGYIDMCYFIFAGYGSYVQGNNENYLWPHALDFSQQARWQGMRYDGKYFGRYACSVELQDYETSADQHQYLDGIGTICHEFSHVLGLADHYDTDYTDNGQAQTPGYWDLMASGTDNNYGLTPVGYNAFERYVLEFTTPRVIDVAGTYCLNPFIISNECYILHTGTQNEDFYIENRQQQGWDRFLPGHGMLVWRADLSDSYVWKSNQVNISPNNLHFELLCATPNKDISSEYTPFPGKGNVTDLTTMTTPALVSSMRTNALFNIYDITESADGSISFEASNEKRFSTVIEDFETMDPTTADATDVKGAFCNWNLTKATIEPVSGDYGYGQQLVKLAKNGILETTPLPILVKGISFKVWNGDVMTRLSVKVKNPEDDTWSAVGNTETLAKNAFTTITVNSSINAGSLLRISTQATNSSAVTYIDDISFTIKDSDMTAVESIQVARPDESQTYNLNGQIVNKHYRGITIRNGKKRVMR